MTEAEFQPNPRLARFVKLYWVLELDDPLEFGPPHRIVTDGIVEAVFHFRQPFETSTGGGPYVRQPRGFVISQTQRPVVIRPEGKSGLISIRFQLGGAHHFFPVPVSEFADQTVDTHMLWRQAAPELEERISLARSNRDRVHILESFLLRQLRNSEKDEVCPLVGYIRRLRGQVSIRQMAADLGHSERGLQRRFESALGAPPKQIARITRFLNACKCIRRGTLGGLTGVAHACGYYDQAHFIRDFREFAGISPSEFSALHSVSFLDPE